MNDTQQKLLFEMIGTDGVEKLITISSLFSEDHSYSDPFCLASHFLNVMLRQYCDIVREEAAKE